MATTVGHALAGLACWLAARGTGKKSATAFAHWHWAPVFMLAANLPDLDFFAGWLWAGDFHAFHGGASHSLLAALLLAAAMTLLFARARDHRLHVFFWLLLAVISHLLIDMSLGATLGLHQASYGLPLLWPFSAERFYGPLTLFYGVEHDTLTRLLSWQNLRTILCELATFSLPLLLLWRYARHTPLTDLPTGKRP